MSIHTPIDNHFKFGELYGIRSSYADMNEAIDEKRLVDSLYDKMMSFIIESGYMEKIERFAKKNRVLCDFTKNNALNEAYSLVDLSKNSINIPKIVKKRAKEKLRIAVSDKALSIKTNEYKIPSFTKQVKEPTIYESDDSFFINEDEEQQSKKEIDKLINDVAIKNGIIWNDIKQSKSDKEFEKSTEDFTEEKKHNYSIQNVIIESFAGNSKKTQLIPASFLYQTNGNDEREYYNSLMPNVLNGINAICGINFADSDYTWMSTGRPSPHIKAEIAVNSELVKGNRLLNAYFGPAGEFKDYLFKPDGTPRIEQSKASSMNDIDRDVNVIQSYPIVKVYSTIISWDTINGQDSLREITKEDFIGTSVKVIY